MLTMGVGRVDDIMTRQTLVDRDQTRHIREVNLEASRVIHLRDEADVRSAQYVPDAALTTKALHQGLNGQ